MTFKQAISISFFFIILFFSCATSNNSNAPEPESPRTVNSTHEKSMLEIIQKLSGVYVRGTGNNAKVRVMVGNYMNAPDTEPLFLLNGVSFAHDFQSVQNSISPEDVKSVEVYKTPAELGYYGARGVNGVINIKLK
jgi:outer membrane receptor for ferrienterochelin and colicin